MTAIVGLVHEGTVWIGGDSAGSTSWTSTVRADLKVFRNGPYLFGFTTSYRMGQLLRHGFLCTTFIDAVRTCLNSFKAPRLPELGEDLHKTGGYATKENEVEAGGTFLVGVSGRLFTVQGDYQVAEAADPYGAVGSGSMVALGSLFSTIDLQPGARVVAALMAAAHHTPYVRPPFTVESL